jgi:hypothetical protein
MTGLPDVAYDDEHSWGTSYDALIETMGYDDYQGDTFLLVRKGERYGVLMYGWGSCSGCDAAQAVGSLKEANELRDQLYNGITWNDSLEDLTKWLAGDDEELQWYGHRDTYKKFVAKVEKHLTEHLVADDEVAAALATIQESISKWSQEGWR